jgi:CRP-like cAMP-binding protein
MAGKEKSLSDHLADVPWFCELQQPLRDRVLQDAYESRHPKGGAVARRGDVSHSWLYVAEGLLKVTAVSRRGRMIMYAGVPEGSWIGEGAVIKRELRRYDVVSMRDSRLIHVPAATFRWLMDTSMEFNHALVAYLNERVSQYITMVDIDRMEDPVGRVAKSLGILFNPVLYPRMSSLVPLSQTELGELAGLSRQRVSSALQQLEQEGLITLGYGALLVCDIGGLRDYGDR